MASNPELVKYIADQLSDAGTVTYRKMFGEYGMYLDGKIFALICDNQLFIKITEAGERMAPELPTAPPYAGAKDYFLFEEIDDRDFLTEFVMATCKELPTPKPKKGKGKAAESKNRQEKANPEKGKTEKKEDGV